MKTIISFATLFFAFCTAFAQTCPVIERNGNTLRVAEPVGGVYQWFLNGAPIVGATGQTYSPTTDGDYTVEVYGFADPFALNLPKYNVTVSGLTLDRKLQPVAGVTVSFAGQTTTSDAAGKFSFPLMQVNRGRITLKYEKAGYFAAGQGLLATKDGEMKTVVCLVDRGTPLTFEADSGLTATTKSAKIEIPKSGLQTANGQLYHGIVKAYIVALSPDDAMYGETMPGGDFRGINGGNQQVVLQSLGIVNVEMETPAGAKLSLAPNKPASLSFRAPKIYKTLAASQTSIPLWHYDETAQLWRQEGEAAKLSNAWFKGEVTHFSWWNCDMNLPIAYIKGCVSNVCSGQGVGFTSIAINERTGLTDANGCFVAAVPAAAALNIYAGENTLSITAPQADDTLTLTGLQTGLNLTGYGYAGYDSTVLKLKVLIASANVLPANLTYSIDGQSFQASNTFTGFTTTPDSVWVKAGSCVRKFRVYFSPLFGICPALSGTGQYYNNLNTALQAQAAGNIVYKLTLAAKPTDVNVFFNNPEVCPCLTYLSLQNNQLTTVPSEIGNLTNLQWLELSYNQLTTLPSEIGNLTNLQRLELSYNQLTTLPSEIGNLSNLQFLNLSGNQLTTLPLEIGNLTTLRNLYLQSNQLTNLPSEIGNLTNLSNLLLHNNQLISLPLEIGNLVSLSELSLEINQLGSIPSGIGNLNSLQLLNLNMNQLTNLPPEICDLKDTVTSFQISNNPGTAAMQAQWDACP